MASCKTYQIRTWLIGIMLTMAQLMLSMELSYAQSADYNKIAFYDVNKKDFVSIQDLMGKKGVVLIFTGSHCPYMDYYEDRLDDIKNEFTSKGVEFVMINSNNSVGIKTESITQMRDESKSSGYRIISDQSHEVMEGFGANKTPEVVVLRFKNGQIIKAYQGAIDDNPKSVSMVNQHYLRLALNNIIQDKPSPVKDTRPVGCLIK